MLDGRNNDVLRFYSSGHPAKKYTHGISCDIVTRFTLELSWKIPSALFLNVSKFYEDHCSHFAVYLLTDLMWLFCIPHLLLVAGWWRWWRCCRRGSWSTTSGPSPSLTPWRTSPSHSTPSRRMASNLKFEKKISESAWALCLEALRCSQSIFRGHRSLSLEDRGHRG